MGRQKKEHLSFTVSTDEKTLATMHVRCWKAAILKHEALHMQKLIDAQRCFNHHVASVRGGGAKSEVVDLTQDDDDGDPVVVGLKENVQRWAWSNSDQNTVGDWASSNPGTRTITTIGNIDLNGKDFHRLLTTSTTNTEKYLNDNNIDAWMGMLQHRANHHPTDAKPTDRFLTTAVHRLLIPQGTMPNRWSTKLRGAVRLFLPWNVSGHHWVLLVIHRDTRHIISYDSMQPHQLEQAMQSAGRWLDNGADNGAKKGPWTTSVASRMPQQTNGFDCGVYVCLTADYLALEGQLPGDLSDRSRRMRVRMAVRFMQGLQSLVTYEPITL